MKIVVGFLRSPEGRAALERAVQEASAFGGEVHLVAHVDRPTGDEGVSGFQAHRDERERELNQAVQELRDRSVDAHGHLPVSQRRPSHALLHVARAEHADLIVIGLRRRSRVGKLLLGSNAQEILLEADCPVLAVKIDAADEVARV